MSEIDTKVRILDAAEKLYAERGFGGTSLRAIIKEAGVNTAAVHYHFGSKDGLIDAVLVRRATPINEERLRLLDALEANGRSGSLQLESVIEAFLEPAIRLNLASSGSRRLFPRLMGRAIAEPDAVVRETIDRVFGEVFTRFSASFARALPSLSEEEVRWRIHFMIGALAFTVAVPIGHDDEKRGVASTKDAGKLLARLVDFVAAGMRAPVSKSTGKEQQ